MKRRRVDPDDRYLEFPVETRTIVQQQLGISKNNASKTVEISLAATGQTIGNADAAFTPLLKTVLGPYVTPIEDTRRGKCVFPLGDPRDELFFRYCCAPVTTRTRNGKPELMTYCECHYALTHIQLKPALKTKVLCNAIG